MINKKLFKILSKDRSLKQSSLKEDSLKKNSLKEISLEANSLKDNSLTQSSKAPLKVENITLCTMQPKKPGKICELETKNPGILQKLIVMGILPGMPITLLRKFPSYFFEVDQTRYAVDKEIANHIYVSY
jgi:ferrous iron transport protein A